MTIKDPQNWAKKIHNPQNCSKNFITPKTGLKFSNGSIRKVIMLKVKFGDLYQDHPLKEVIQAPR